MRATYWIIASGERRAASGERRAASGERRAASGERRALSLTAVALATSAMGCIEYTNLERLPAEEPETCTITDESFMPVWDSGRSVSQGRSVAIVSMGESPGDQNSRKVVLAGAPGADDDDLEGHVTWADGSTTFGTVPSTTPGRIPVPSGTRYQFGAALHAVDVKECQFDAALGKDVACGQEFLVGAPDRFVGDTPGRAFLYESAPESSPSDMRLVGEIPLPAGTTLLNGSDFGAAFASPALARDLDTPWEVAPATTDWVAISAPGAKRVFIYYDLDRTQADPFAAAVSAGTVTMIEMSGLAGHQFGYALSAGDYDDDGLPDLAVGVPGSDPFSPTSNTDSEIWMYWGTDDPLDPYYPLLEPNEGLGISHNFINTVDASGIWHDSDMMNDLPHCPGGLTGNAGCTNGGGTTLASGRVLLDDNRDVLFAGYPTWGMGAGYVCQFVFDDRTKDALTNCFPDPSRTTIDRFRFGQSVAVGDFNPTDNWGSNYSNEGRLLELAVGSPHAEGPSGTAEAGRVDIFASNGDGIDELSAINRNLRDAEGDLPLGHFGANLASGYIHDAPFEDLVVGSPERATGDGNAVLTVALNPNGCHPMASAEGKWTTDDLDSVPQQVELYNHPEHNIAMLRFVTGFALELRDSSGALCTSSKDPAFTGRIQLEPDSMQGLDAPLNCTVAGTQVWTGVESYDIINRVLVSMGVDDKSVNAEVDVTVVHTSSTVDLSISFSKLPTGQLGLDGSCNLVGNPFVLHSAVDVCETQ